MLCSIEDFTINWKLAIDCNFNIWTNCDGISSECKFGKSILRIPRKLSVPNKVVTNENIPYNIVSQCFCLMVVNVCKCIIMCMGSCTCVDLFKLIKYADCNVVKRTIAHICIHLRLLLVLLQTHYAAHRFNRCNNSSVWTSSHSLRSFYRNFDFARVRISCVQCA